MDFTSAPKNEGYTFEEQFKQLYELSDDPKRKEFLDDLLQFMAERNQPVNRIPIMAKQVLDLYELYNLVVARGGLVEVINKKIWREITKGLNLPSSITSAAFTLRTQYMKYLYPYECAKNNFSHQEELQQAIDGNRREGRRAGSASLSSGGYAPYLSAGPNSHEPAHHLHQNSNNNNNNNHHSHHHHSSSNNNQAQLINTGHHHYQSASASPTNHLFLAGANLLAQQQLPAHQQQPQRPQSQQQQQPLQLLQESRDQQRPRSSGSLSISPSASPPSANFNQQRLYQDSISSDHEDEGSLDMGHSSKRNSPIDLEDQHLDSNHNLNRHHLNQQLTATTEQQQQQLAAAAAAIRQQLGAAMNFAGSQNFLGQLAGSHPTSQAGNNNNNNPILTPNSTIPNVPINTSSAAAAQTELIKQQQEQFLAVLMAAANQQQQQQQQNATSNPDQQATAASRVAQSMVASNAMLIAAPNAPDAMAMATAAQALGVKGAFIILLL